MTHSGHQHEGVLRILEARFQHHHHRHPRACWPAVLDRLLHHSPGALSSLRQMVSTCGEPDTIGLDAGSYDAARGFRGLLRV